MKRSYYEVIDGQVVSDRAIAGKCKRTPAGILLGNEDLMARWVVSCQTRGLDSSLKSFPERDIITIRKIMNELIKNSFHIIGEDNSKLRIALATYPKGIKPKKTFPDQDDIEVIDRVEGSKKGLDGLGKLMGSRHIAEQWVERMIGYIRAKQPQAEVPF